MALQQRILSRTGEILLFALTPPRLATTPQRAQEIAALTRARLEPLDLDGLVLYDVDDEADRNPVDRPFPFLPTMDPADYLERHLRPWRTPVVIYRATAKYAPDELRRHLAAQDPERQLAVLVGASTRGRPVATTLRAGQ
ncbi:MAG TPA: 5,10-methylenetetrahydrofolate reductase, partial [Candidatus Angelobacter sp.]|nr:5,10-methylenetetrahydrofolate reductase [Candidatus Angelobacter sp.]